ncbi:MAG: hypothetical protein J6S85_01000 [Methanobrevibacter sp.]|nr:hypothetical protein [Methanobrevibacter sp.]MBO7712110.1 hypothetical protein [Methanobrevibacter sp.]
MALQDYWIDLYFVEKVRQPDGTGGFEYVYQIGDTFKGGAVKSSTSEQIVASVRGNVGEQYTITTNDNNALSLGDIIMFVNPDNQRVFLRLNSNLTYTPDKSGQSEWKYGTATKIEPDLRVVD